MIGLYLTGAKSMARAQGRGAAAKSDALALNGGSRAVTYPRAKRAAAFKWPPYGDEEKKVVTAALDCNAGSIYRYGPRLEARFTRVSLRK